MESVPLCAGIAGGQTGKTSVRQVAVNYRSSTVTHARFGGICVELLSLTQLSLFPVGRARCVGPDAAVGDGRARAGRRTRSPGVSIWPIMNAQFCPRGIARFTATDSAASARWSPTQDRVVPQDATRKFCAARISCWSNPYTLSPPAFRPSRRRQEASFEWPAKSCNCFSEIRVSCSNKSRPLRMTRRRLRRCHRSRRSFSGCRASLRARARSKM